MANVRHWIARSVLRLSLLALATVAMLAMLAQPASAAVVHHTTSATQIGAQTLSTDRSGDKIYTVSTASPALIPLSASGCVGTLPWNNIRTCFGIVGSGRYVDYMWVQAYVRNTAVTALVQIYGPPGNLGNTPFIYLRPGETLTLTVSLYRNMPTGKYCGQTVALGPGSGTACESVIA